MQSIALSPLARTVKNPRILDKLKKQDAIGAGKRAVYQGGAILGYRSEIPREKKRYCLQLHRLRELEKIITHRHGLVIPQTEDADIYVDFAAMLLLVIDREAVETALPEWCKRWAPWADKKFIEAALYERLKQRYEMPCADTLGKMLHLSYQERSFLDVRTIGSHDVDRKGRAKLQAQKRRERDKARKAKQRRGKGSVVREDYLARSLSRQTPWLKEGISRSAWYRRRRQTEA